MRGRICSWSGPAKWHAILDADTRLVVWLLVLISAHFIAFLLPKIVIEHVCFFLLKYIVRRAGGGSFYTCGVKLRHLLRVFFRRSVSQTGNFSQIDLLSSVSRAHLKLILLFGHR
mmetsp:Transcript_29047/g.36002  ORF Transcript_29047/g.36002 Transcript_29047/m.36002 type:complete len:115 (-) Transcript_29047:976-1320(-)